MIKKLKRRYSKVTEDHGSWWIGKCYIYNRNLYTFLSGVLVGLILKIKNVHIEGKNTFFGLPHFHRHPYSTIKIGKSCVFRSDQASNLIGVNHKCILSTHNETAILIIGNNCGFSGSSIGAAKEIRIGDNVLCGANVVITDFDWHADISHTDPKAVVINNNVWIGLNSVILKGVTIGENSIIGANSLVVKDIPANVIAGGNPCRVLRPIS
jgi:acetyltransferase-like isoleucine patch superfamily enzyme